MGSGLQIREFSFGPLGFVPLGFGSLDHGIWPSIRVFGTQILRGTNIKGTNLKSLIRGFSPRSGRMASLAVWHREVSDEEPDLFFTQTYC